MIKYFINKWNKNKDKLEEYIKTHNQEDYANSYEELLKQVIEIVFNEENEQRPFNTDIQTVDFGDYQGTLILTFSTCAYQPSEDETFYTVVSYGSCSGCDTLLSISSYEEDKLPDEEQIKDYMTLCLHMVQKIKCFGELDEWELGDYYD